ncbi:MAG: hypothetical protein Q4D07_10175, partial [Selenomonadaceae bacterium]|nr:hypothetical protein [Selenomonadaceae bacterium]
MKTSTANEIELANSEIRYDMQVKRVLSLKVFLSRILKGTMKEFADTDLATVEASIEGNPELGCIPVMPGGANGERIIGCGQEDGIPGEGRITYDIRTYVVLPDGQRTKIIINIEAQRNNHPGYDLVTRGIFYCARLLSAQLGTEFSNSGNDSTNYDNLKKVYSIWICLDAPSASRNSIISYSLKPESVFKEAGTRLPDHRHDLLTVVMVNLSTEEKGSENNLVGMLTELLSDKDAQEKEMTLQSRYGILMNEEVEREMSSMCNLSSYIVDKGIAKGMEKGM